MKRMYPTTPILTTPNDHKSVASMNTGRLLRNAYLTSRDEYPSSLLPYNPGLGDMWVSSIHQHDYAMQFIKRGKVLPYVISPIAKVIYCDNTFKADILPTYNCNEQYWYANSRLYIHAYVYIVASLRISSIKEYAKEKNSLLRTDVIRDAVAKVVRNGEAERYLVGFYQYTGFHKEPDLCDIYFPSLWFPDIRINNINDNEVRHTLHFFDSLSSVIFYLVIEANARYPIKKLESKYGKEYYYKSAEFKNKLSEDVKFYTIDEFNRCSFKLNKYYTDLEIFKIRIKEV